MINDDPWLAKNLNADGCHLGQKDTDILNARKILGKKIIGITCHNSIVLAKRAIKNKADYFKMKCVLYFLHHYLYNLKKKIKKNYSLFNEKKIKKDLINLGASEIDYLENYNIKNFKKIKKQNKKFNIFIAYYIKNTRLIDNI